MLTFLLYTAFMWLAGNCVLRIFFMMIEPDGAIDVVFKWRAMLDRLYGSTNKYKNLLGKALGDCHMCTSFWFMPLWFVIYWAMSRLALHYYITDAVTPLLGKIFVAFIWYVMFHAVGAMGGLFTLIKFKKKSTL